ncbi:MAG: malto-oligosyltrehalose synthase [bacterium]
MHIPLSTYRIQFNPSFGFNAARNVTRYLAQLGISDLYASPIFKVRAGSMHGYDVVDPNQLNPELGTHRDFENLIQELRNNSMFWLQDIVPNHMAFDSQNHMLMDVIENMKNSEFFHFFDIDWDHFYESLNGKLLAPFLGKFYSESLEEGDIQLSYDENDLGINYYSLRLPLKLDAYVQVFKYNIDSLEQRLGGNNPDFIKYLGALYLFNNVASLHEKNQGYDRLKHAKRMLWEMYSQNPTIKEFMDGNISFFNGTKGDPHSFNHLEELLAQQPFRLSFWKVAAEEINYRRFFSINGLISLRIEEREVFDYTHELIFTLIKEGKFDGLRIDHIDGLWDPTTYLQRIREKAEQVYTIVEKILDFDETLSPVWPVQGTTGYDFTNYVNGIFCSQDHKKSFAKIYRMFTGFHTPYHDLVAEKKRLIIGKHMAGNIDNLAHLMKKIAGRDRYGIDITLYALKRALVEVMSHFPVYRSYINRELFSETDKAYITQAIYDARRGNPDLVYELNFIEKFFSPDFPQHLPEEENEQLWYFIMQFQQFTGPLMAKGFEDTVLYIYNRLISLNEVGSAPDRFGVSIKEFHDFNNNRLLHQPHSLNATSTHDTKRGEDMRARINVLSEIPDEWGRHLKKWSKMNKHLKNRVHGTSMPDENDEYFLYQTLLGVFPFGEYDYPRLLERMKHYIIKAVREAKRHTAWIKPDTEYENACISFVEKLLNPSEENLFLKEFLSFQKKVAFFGIFNSLSQVLMKITSPGIPDFYQGTELWDLTLVDPDNRTSVDFKQRERILHDIKEKERGTREELIAELCATREDGRIKLFLIYRALTARRARVDLFERGEYIPIEVVGEYRECVIAYARHEGEQWAVIVAPRFLTNVVSAGDYPMGEGVWKDTALIMPEGAPLYFFSALTDEPIHCERQCMVGKILEHFPVGLMVNTPPSPREV